jgi:hypothetical protein
MAADWKCTPMAGRLDLLCCQLTVLELSAGDDHIRSRQREAFGYGAADTPASPGDYGDLPGHIEKLCGAFRGHGNSTSFVVLQGQVQGQGQVRRGIGQDLQLL